MPRFAATMLGLVLAACSIGFNTKRYPVVWDMVNPAKEIASETPAATVSPASKPAQPEPPAPTPQPPKPIAVQPVSEVSDAGAKVDAKAAENNASVGAEVAANDDAASAEPEDRKPLVPVVPVSSPGPPGTPEDVAAGGAGICRLPPVDPNGPSPAELQRQLFGNSIPFYPSTGIK